MLAWRIKQNRRAVPLRQARGIKNSCGSQLGHLLLIRPERGIASPLNYDVCFPRRNHERGYHLHDCTQRKLASKRIKMRESLFSFSGKESANICA